METEKKYSSYIAEKLSLGINETTEKLTELINGVMEEIMEELFK